MKTEIVEETNSQVVSARWFVELSDSLRKSLHSTKETVCRIYLENYHEIGGWILESKPHWKGSGLTQESLLELLTETTGHCRRNLFYAIKLATMFPDFSAYCENERNPISWTGFKKMIDHESGAGVGGSQKVHGGAQIGQGFAQCPQCLGRGFIPRGEEGNKP